MVLRGHVKNGQITFDDPVRLPEGAEVHVEVLPPAQPADGSALSQLAQLAIPGHLPRDFSQQHEHYVKGAPRKRSAPSSTLPSSLHWC